MENNTGIRRGGSIKKPVFSVLLAAAFVVSGFFVPQSAFAAATVTPATNGTNVSIDTTSAGGTGIHKPLSGPGINELVAGDISIGIHTITLPAGWEFEISAISISTFGSDIVFESISITPSPTSFSFNVTALSTTGGFVGFGGLKVRPTGTTPSTGNMTYSGAGIVGVDGSTNFGTLSTVPGTVAKLAFTTQPGGAVYGSLLNPQPTVKTQDQFGNNSTSGLVATEMVSLTLTGTGVLQGTLSFDIGTSAGNGTVTFADLKVGDVGAIGTKGLTASATDLANAISGNFEITQKPLTATVTVNNKPYDGNNSAVITNVALNGIEPGDVVTVDNQGTATFASSNANTGIVVTSNGVTIIGTHAGNYSFGGTATGVANITPLGITVTPTAGQTKIYGQADPVFAYTNTPALIDGGFTGALSRVAGEDVNTYAYTLGNLSAGSNYTLTLGGAETFAITVRTLNVTATGVNKVYDANTTATATLTDDRVPLDEITLGYTATFTDSKNVGTNKPVSVTGISITGGADMGNYTLNGVTIAATTANITSKPLTVSFTTNINKTYDGDNSANITGRTLDGVISPEVVNVTGGSATFTDKHIGLAKTVTATGFTLTGADSGNYSIGTINTTTGNVNARPIIVTAGTDSRIYDGTTNSSVIPTVSPDGFATAIQTGDTANFTQTYDNKNVGTGKTLTPSGTVNDGNNGLNYSYTFVTDTTGVITPKSINVTAQPDTKTYDGTTSSDEAPVVDALETGDTVETAPIQSYDTEDVWVNKVLTASGLVINDGNGGANYNIIYVNNGTGVINAKGLTVSGATTNPKIYNGDDEDADVNFTNAELVGIVPGEEALVSLDSAGYSATFNNKNVATGKTVTILGLDLSGTGASNYSLTQPTLNDGVITVRTLVVTADGTTKVYDGNDNATIIVTLSNDRVLGDDIALTHTATFDGPNGKNVGTDKPVSVTDITITGGVDAGNYTLGNTTAGAMADITPANLTATITAADKTYDGNDSATIIGRTPIDVIGSDEIILTGGTATFADANVGINKVVSAVGITHTGDDALNYSYNGTATGEADITPLGITGSFSANNKVYDGNTSAEVLTQLLTGVLPGDIGNVILTGGTAGFADPNVADGIVVTEIMAMTLTGSAAGNYELTGVAPTDADITKAPLIITADDKSKEYGDVNPTLTASYIGFVNSETASVLDIPVVLSTTAVDASSVGTYPITALGALDNNYDIMHVDGILTVDPAPIEITPNGDQGKIYGDSDEEITYTASGFKNGEDAESVFTGALGRASGENAGEYFITIGTLDVGGNYFVDSFFDIEYTIEQRELTVTAVTDTKVYDGTTDSAGTPTITDGSLAFSDTAGFTQTYDNENIGEDKTITPDGIVNDGNGGENYTVTFIEDETGEITKLEITITPNAGQSKVFGDEEPTFTYTNTPALIAPDVFTGALSRDAGENVGTYAYTLGTLTDGLDNYSLTLVDETFAITKATPVITWANPADIVYGAALSGTQLNATADVAGVFIYTPVSGTVLNAGAGQTLSVAFTPTDTANYNNAEETVLIIVTPKSLTVTANNQNKVYGTTLTFSGTEFTTSELVDGDDVTSVTLTSDGSLAAAIAADYDIVPSVAVGSGLSNYDIAYDNGILTVADTVTPTVVSHTPSFNALNINPTTPIIVTFSEPVVVEEENISFSPEISGGFTITDSETDVVTITPNDPLEDNTTYTMTLDNVVDINGNPLPFYNGIKFTTATNYSIDLNANASGWNLISLPVVPSNTAIATVLGSAADNIDAVWTYDPTNLNAVNGWLVFVPGNPEGTNNLTLMTTGFGYWVSVTGNANLSGSGTLLIAGPTSPPSRSLQSGWNLIGYYQLPNEDESIPADAFASIGAPVVGYNGLWGFDNTTGFFKEVTAILPGDGFWISLPSAKDYTPSNL